jgi:hypothetical protein
MPAKARPSSYAELMDWANGLADEHIAADADRTQALILEAVRSFESRLDEVQLRCLRCCERRLRGEQPIPSEEQACEGVARRLSDERPKAGRWPPDQARNRLVFAASTTSRGQLDWQVAEYLVTWMEDAEISFPVAMAAFARHVPEFG